MDRKVTDLLTWLNSLWDHERVVTVKDAEKFFAPRIEFYLNHERIADGIEEYVERVNALRKSCKMLKHKLPLKECVKEGDRVAFLWEETIVFPNGTRKELINAGFIHFNGQGKIVKFIDLFNGRDPVR